MKHHRYLLVAAALLVLAAGCKNVEPSNPFDPDTPSGDKATAVLSGTVSAEAAAATTIVVALPELGVSRVPDADGRFEIRDIQAGSHLIEVAAEGHVSYRDSRYFPVGGTVVLELTLTAHRGGLHGLAQLEGESRHGGILVALSQASAAPGATLPPPGDQHTRTVLTDGEGGYGLFDVPVGTYRLNMEKEGFTRGGVTEVNVTAETVTVVPTVVLKPVTGAVDVFGGPDFATPDYDNEHYSRTLDVRLRVYGFNAVQMKVSEDQGLADAEWENYATELSWTLSDADGPKTVYVLLRDEEGNESERLEGHTVLDRAAPEVGEHSLLIDGGAAFSADSSGLVDLALRADDATSGTQTMWISADPDLAGAAAQGYGELVPGFRVASGDVADDGLKTVFARFADVAGNLSDVASAQIYLDRQAPANAAVGVDGLSNGFARVRPPLLVLSADEPCDDEYPGGCTAGITAPAEVQLSESDAFAHAAWQPFAEFVSFDLSPDDGDKTVHVRYRDAAGNISLAASASFVLDTVAPSGPSLLIANGADFVNAAAVPLTLFCEGADEMILDDSPDFGAASWVAYANSASFDLLGDDGLHTVYARFRDEAGNFSEVTLDSVELDTVSPLIPDSGLNVADQKYDGIDHGFTDREAVVLFLQASGAEAMKVSTQADLADASWEAFASSAAVLLPADGLNTIYLCVRDEAGNQSCEFESGGAASAQTFLDTQPPFAPVLADVARPVVAEDQITLILDAEAADPGEGATGAFLTHQLRGGAFTGWTDVADVSGGLGFDLAAGDGDYLLEVRGKDRAGNVSAVDVVVVSRDTVAPATPVLRQGAEPPVVNQEIYSVMLDQSAAERPTDDPHFSHYEMLGGQLADWTFTAATDSFPFLLVQGSPTPAGNTLTVRAVDLAGNISGEASITVIEDSVPPTPPELYPAGGTVVADWVPLSLSSPGSDDYPSHYEVLGGEYLNFTNVGTYEFFNPQDLKQDFRVGLRPNRANQISVRLVDKAGNTSYPATVTVQEQRFALIGEVTAPGAQYPRIVADHSLVAVGGWGQSNGPDVGFWWASGGDPFMNATAGDCNSDDSDDYRRSPPVALEGSIAAFGGRGVWVNDTAAEEYGMSVVAAGFDVKGIAMWGREGAFIANEPLALVHTPPGPVVEESQGMLYYGVVYQASRDVALRSITFFAKGGVVVARMYKEESSGSGEFVAYGESCIYSQTQADPNGQWVSIDLQGQSLASGERMLIGIEAESVLVHPAVATASDPTGGTLQRGVWFDPGADPEAPINEVSINDLSGLPRVRVVTSLEDNGDDTRTAALFGPGDDGVHGSSDDSLSLLGHFEGDRSSYRLFEAGAAVEAEAPEGNRGYLFQTPDEPIIRPKLEVGIPFNCSDLASFAANLYESDQLEGVYSLVHSETTDPQDWGGGDLNYHRFMLDSPLQPNKFYYLVISWSGPCATYQSAGTLPLDDTFGTWSCPVRDKDLGGALYGGSAPATLALNGADCAATTTPLMLSGSLQGNLPEIAGLLRGEREVVWAEAGVTSAEIKYVQSDASGDFSGATPQTLASPAMLLGDNDSTRELGFSGSDRYVCWTDFLEASEEQAVRCHDRGEDLLLATADDPAGNPIEVFRMDLPFAVIDGVRVLSVYQDRLAVLVSVAPRYYIRVHDIPTGERVLEIPVGPLTLDIELTGDILYALEPGTEGKFNLYRHSFSRNKWLVTSEQGEEYLPSMVGDRCVFAQGSGELLDIVLQEYDQDTASTQLFELGAEGAFFPQGKLGKYYLVQRIPPGWTMAEDQVHLEYGLHDPELLQYVPLSPNMNMPWPVSSAEIDGNRVAYQHVAEPGRYETILLDLVDDTYGNGDDVLVAPAFTVNGDGDTRFELAIGGQWIVQSEQWSYLNPIWVHDLQNGTTEQRDDIGVGHIWAISGDLLIHTLKDSDGIHLTRLPIAPTPETFSIRGQWFDPKADYRPMRQDGSRFLMFAYHGGGWPVYLDAERRTAVPAGMDLVSQMELPYSDMGISQFLTEGQFVYGQQGPFTSDLYLYEVGEVF